MTSLLLLATLMDPESKFRMTEAPIRQFSVDYSDNTTTYHGFAAFPSHITKPVPAVMIIHQAQGISEFEKERARGLALEGYYVFVPDMYGDMRNGQYMWQSASNYGSMPSSGGQRTSTTTASDANSTTTTSTSSTSMTMPNTPVDVQGATGDNRSMAMMYTSNPTMLRVPLTAAYQTISHARGVDPSRIAVVGYGFGGAAALDMATLGLPILGYAAIDSDLSMLPMTNTGRMNGRFLVINGADDTHMNQQSVDTWRSAWDKGNVRYRWVTFPNTAHGFTMRESGMNTGDGTAYNEVSDSHQWGELGRFLAELFNSPYDLRR